MLIPLLLIASLGAPIHAHDTYILSQNRMVAPVAKPEPLPWYIFGTFRYHENDNDKEGTEIRLPLANYATEQECNAAAAQHAQAARQVNGMVLHCEHLEH